MSTFLDLSQDPHVVMKDACFFSDVDTVVASCKVSSKRQLDLLVK